MYYLLHLIFNVVFVLYTVSIATSSVKGRVLLPARGSVGIHYSVAVTICLGFSMQLKRRFMR